jgi:hypothetical protein
VAKVKHHRPQKPVRDHPHTPLLEGTPMQRGDAVTHPRLGAGRIGWYEWRGPQGEWIPPLDRVTAWGDWVIIVTTDTGGYRCPIGELTRAVEPRKEGSIT